MASESGVRKGEREVLHDGLCSKQVLKMLAGETELEKERAE
jgi:hypothetical protein